MTLEPTGAERRLIDAAREGQVANYNSGDRVRDDPANGSTWCSERTIRAEIICHLLTGSHARWEVHSKGVDIRGARITGELYLGGAALKSRLALIGCRIDKCLNLVDASASSIALTGSYLCGGIQAERLNVRGSLFLDRVTAKGEVKLLGATISGQLKCRRAHFCSSGGTALNADGATICGGVFLDQGFTSKGEVRLVRAQIAGELTCRGSRVEAQGAAALTADGVRAIGGLFLDREFDKQGAPVGDPFVARGEVRLLHAKVTGQLSCSGGTFENPNGDALRADGAIVNGEFLLNQDFAATGAVTAMTAKISGNMVCTRGKFDALILERAQVAGTLSIDDLNSGAANKIDLRLMHARVGQLVDDRRSWPASGNLRIEGFEYDAIAPSDAGSRLDWLRLAQNEHFSTQPYEQLENVLRSTGDETGARAVYIEKRRTVRKTGNVGAAAQTWDWFLDWSIRYGYQTWRAFIWALLIVTIGAFPFWSWFWSMQTPLVGAATPVASGQVEKSGGATPNFVVKAASPRSRLLLGLDHFLFSFSYSLDVFLPFGDLHLKSAHPLRPRGPQDWWFYVYELWYVVEMISGWIIAGLIAGAVTGLIRR